MRAKSMLLLSTVLLIGLPAAAQAQSTEAERRMFEVQQQVRELELWQRVEQVERAVETLELRQRTDENLCNMRAATDLGGPVFPNIESPPLIPNRSRPATTRPRTQDEIQAAELAASNARLRALTQSR